MDKTPLQQAIENFKSHIGNLGSESDLALEVCVHYLESILPKEKEFVEKAFQAGADWATEVLDSYVRRPKEPDVNQFINQLYPKQ